MKKILSFLLALVLVFAFAGCNEDTGAPEGATNQVTEKGEINPDFFTWKDTKITGYSETGLKQKNIIIPKECTEFSYGALKENETVETISFEGDDVVLNGHLFAECKALKSVELPKNITTIPKSLLKNCSSLKSVEIPNGVLTIESMAFYGCEALESVKLSSNLEEISQNAFSYCKALKNIEFPSTLKVIGPEAFDSNSALQNFTLPDSLETIGHSAFFNCGALTSVTIPKGVTELPDRVFMSCGSLEKIYIPANIEKLSTNSISQTHAITVYVKEGSFADGAFDDYHDGFSVKAYY